MPYPSEPHQPARWTQPVADMRALTGVVVPHRYAALIHATAEAAGLRPATLMGRSREPRIVQPRQVAMALCRELPGASLPRIGRIFRRDHTTVLHACRAVAARMDDDLAAAMAGIRQRAGMAQEGDQ